MTRLLLHASAAAVVATGFFSAPTAAPAQQPESPITPGFWSFPRQKATTAQDIAAACRAHFEVQFPNGRFFGLGVRRTEKTIIEQAVDDVGHCRFNRDTQTDVCDMKVNHADGSVSIGTMDVKYSLDPDKTLKMTVTPKMINDAAYADPPFDAFPVRCPDDLVWGALNEVAAPK